MDGLRLMLMREPRGHGAMSGAILQPALHEDADWGVLFIEVSGCLPMCGHGTIGVATVLVETGMVEASEPETVVRLDTPAGLVEARVAVENGRARSVALRNVPSFLLGARRPRGGGRRPLARYDMAFGGNFYAILPLSRGSGGRPQPGPGAGRGRSGDHAAINEGDRPEPHPATRAHRRLQALLSSPRPARTRPLAAQRALDPPGLARPLALRYRNLGQAGRAAARGELAVG